GVRRQVHCRDELRVVDDNLRGGNGAAANWSNEFLVMCPIDPLASGDRAMPHDAGACEDILGFRITTKSQEACLREILFWIEGKANAKYFACLNPHSIEIARRDEAFAAALRDADLSLPDGVGILIASRILGGNIRKRITGSDIFWGLNRALEQRGGSSVFFLGSTPETLEKIVARMGQEYPRVRIAGVYSPPFREVFSAEENAAMVSAINAARADVLWVGMTAPKQEKWVRQHCDRLDVRLIGPVGAVFDFFTGRVQRSSPLFQRLGLEWLPRLLQEPRRLWRRNFVSNPSFLLRVIRARLARS
ncbi:MAG: WecB/TagA/CpsF family glycosyltransferase, partial [Pseudomonadota bacterium]